MGNYLVFLADRSTISHDAMPEIMNLYAVRLTTL